MIMINTMDDLVIEGNAELEQFITGEHLAYYFVLSCVAHMSRLDIKQDGMQKGHVLNLMERYPEARNILDNFLNGRFEELSLGLNKIQQSLCYDMFFGSEFIFKAIRNKNLQQYVAPYKVIDLNEIAAAFGVSLQTVENDLVEQISQGMIHAKIDSHQKILYSKQVNVQIETY